MIDLKQLFDAYNLCARFAPGFLFIVGLFFFEGEQEVLFRENHVFFIALIIILSSIAGFLSALLAKPIEQFVWRCFGNPTVNYLRKKDIKLYEQLCREHGEEKIATYIKSVVRGDNKLLWKNIAYGFCRNSIPLSLSSLLFSYPSQHLVTNFCIFVFSVVATYFSMYCYAHQAIESYKEIKHHSQLN